MAEWILSNWRATWDPDGTPLELLDWGDRMADTPKLPQQHQVTPQAFLMADFPTVYDRGNVGSTLDFSRIQEYSTAAARDNAVMDHWLALAALRDGTLRLEIQGGNSYDIIECGLRSATPETNPKVVGRDPYRVLWRYSFVGGELMATPAP